MKKHLAKKVIAFVAILLIGFLPSICAADTIVYTGAPGDWSDGALWRNLSVTPNTTGALPTTADTAIINGNRIADVNSVIGTVAGGIIVSNQFDPAMQGTLNVNSGGSLTYDGVLSIASAAGGAGTLNITGGNLTSINDGSRLVLGGSAGGTFNLSGGTFTAQGSAPTDGLTIRDITLNLSGGTFDLSGGQVVPQNVTFNVIGDDTTILTDRLNHGGAASTATYNFVFDSDGVSSFTNAAFMNLINATINVDGSAYTGGAGTFTLFDSANLVEGSTSQNITGAFAGFDAVFSTADNGNDVILTLTTAVPEPSSLILLGGGMIGFCLRRRR